MPEDERPQDENRARWHPVWGDRCQELVWIGVDVDEAKLRAMLDSCLLTDAEMALGPEGWAQVGKKDREGLCACIIPLGVK